MAIMGTPLRKLDLAESTFWLLDRASSMNFAVFADGIGELQGESVKKALQWLQKKHPMLQVSILHDSDDGSLSFHSESASSLNEIKFAESTVSDDAQEFSDEVGRAIMKPFENGEAPLMRCGLIQGPDRFRLYLIFHHSIADGRSGIALLDSLVRRLANSESELPDQSTDDLPAGVHERLPAGGEPEMEQKPAQALKLYQKKKGPPSASLLEIQIRPDLLTSLRSTGKANGATLHGVLGACLLQSLANLEARRQAMEPATSKTSSASEVSTSTSSDALRMALASPADLRGQMSNPAADDLALYISLITTTVDVPSLQSWEADQASANVDSFWSLARSISQDVHHQVSDGPLDFYRMLPDPGRYLTKPDPGKAYGALIQRLPQALAFSNAGIVKDFAEPENQSWRIQNAAFSVHPSVSQVMFVAATTYSQQLTLTIHIDANRWPDRGLKLFEEELSSVLNRLEEALSG